LRKAIDQRSAMKRMIHREGYPGYSQDVRRVLATFVTSNARLASKNLHFSNMLEAAENIPKTKGDVRDEATKLVKYVQEPQEEAHGLRGLLFAQYIGGNVASGAGEHDADAHDDVPVPEPVHEPREGGGQVLSAMKQAAGHPEGELGEALARAEQAGVVSPQEIHHLNAEAMATFGSHPVMQKAMFLWGSLFSVAEQFNRRVAFIAAYDTAVGKKKMADPYQFAVKASKKPKASTTRATARTGRAAPSARRCSRSSNSASRTSSSCRACPSARRRSRWRSCSGGRRRGLPFADDIEDVIDTIAQRWATTSTRRQRRASSWRRARRGRQRVPAPRRVEHSRHADRREPAHGPVEPDSRHRHAAHGHEGPHEGRARVRGARRQPMVQNATKVAGGEGWPAWRRRACRTSPRRRHVPDGHAYRDSKGRKVIDTDAADAVWKGIGFQPADVAEESMKQRLAYSAIEQAKEKQTELAEAITRARFEGDTEAEQEARAQLRQWNEDNPDATIKVTPQSVQQRLKAMRATRVRALLASKPHPARACPACSAT
jgi:hypothetical protein